MAKKATQTTTAPKENNSAVINVTKLPTGRAGDWLIPAKKVSDRLKVEFYDSLVEYLWNPKSNPKHISNFCGMLMTMANAGQLHTERSVILPKESKAVLDYIENLGVSSTIKKTLKEEFKLGDIDTVEKAKERATQLL